MRDIRESITLEIEGIEDVTGISLWFKNHGEMVVTCKNKEDGIKALIEIKDLALLSYTT